MKTITEKEKKGLLLAVRALLRSVTTERLSQQSGLVLIEGALEKGITFDEILNPANYDRFAKSLDLRRGESPTAKQYFEFLCAEENENELLALRDEKDWHNPEAGFMTVAEAMHDFFQEVSGKGGQWKTQSALNNLANVLRAHSLESILCEELINRMKDNNPEITFFGFIQAIARDFNSLGITEENTEAEKERFERRTRLNAKTLAEQIHQAEGIPEPDAQPDPEEIYEPDPVEDEPYPEEDENISESDPGFNGMDPGRYDVGSNRQGPDERKRSAVINIIENYTPKELAVVFRNVPDAGRTAVWELLDRISAGRIRPEGKESAEASDIHQQINGDLKQYFLDCMQYYGYEMKEEEIDRLDLLFDSWDLREPAVRRYNKLRRLILENDPQDEDLMEILKEIEKTI